MGTAAIILLIGIAAWWAVSAAGDRKDPLNKADAYAYRENGILYWLNLNSRGGKVKGKQHRMNIIEKIGDPPFLEEKHYSLRGEKTGKGYELTVTGDGKKITYAAWFNGPNLMVQEQGRAADIYKAVGQKIIDDYVKDIQQEFETAVYHSEEKENKRLRKFFSDLNHIYGFLYTSENGSYQLFLKIDEALLEGELTGSLLLMADTGTPNNSYEETNYALNGITDGQMLEFYTNVDGKQTKLKGTFHGDAAAFDLSFWLSEDRLPFKAVMEEEYKRSYAEFKAEALKRK
ncbi:hypothetical protein DRW41_05635 [Neobacillus piezotolerans]|uniref:Uncharacterized protein n=1 Tax=Neobacillus piezotolerans TaxID=2259171 RepID=A0A3D8GSY9_9BACI|nr:hypothetical protein [Neobacillus piezotolerans]RDU37329.1 hypothetical protein DRW41_05635 [Neobacillus piezotolerans]